MRCEGRLFAGSEVTTKRSGVSGTGFATCTILDVSEVEELTGNVLITASFVTIVPRHRNVGVHCTVYQHRPPAKHV